MKKLFAILLSLILACGFLCAAAEAPTTVDVSAMEVYENALLTGVYKSAESLDDVMSNGNLRAFFPAAVVLLLPFEAESAAEWIIPAWVGREGDYLLMAGYNGNEIFRVVYDHKNGKAYYSRAAAATEDPQSEIIAEMESCSGGYNEVSANDILVVLQYIQQSFGDSGT